jgi:NADH-quinone oxidoreductase subunit J
MDILFLIVAVITLASAVMVVTTRQLLHAALWLVLTLFGVAVLFAMLEASFFAVLQVMVYIGAISILIIFAIMLTRRIMEDTGPQVRKAWPFAALAALVVFGGLAMVVMNLPTARNTTLPAPDGQQVIMQLGMDFVNPQKFAIPFEVASVLLLAAMIGAVYVAAERKGGKQ